MPVPFYQCLIIMVFDAAHKVYVPVAWILMSGKTEECCGQAFNWLTSAVEDIDASYIGVDFERAFFTQLGTHFPDAKLMGCLFHFKQAARRKMVDLGIPDSEIKFAMARGMYDLLTVIPIDQLEKGVVYVRTKIIDFSSELSKSVKEEEEASVERWDKFWEYFEW